MQDNTLLTGEVRLATDDELTRRDFWDLMNRDVLHMGVLVKRLPAKAKRLLPDGLHESITNMNIVELRGIVLEYRVVDKSPEER